MRRRKMIHVRAAPEIPSEIEEHRDRIWRRENARQVSTAIEAERLIDQVGFAACRRLQPARALALHSGMRTPRCRHAAQRAEGRRSLAGVGVERRGDSPRPCVLREAGARPGHIYRAADGSVLQRHLGPAAFGRAQVVESQRAEDPARASQRVGDGDLESRTTPASAIGSVHRAIDE